jgi:hypothetical protein
LSEWIPTSPIDMLRTVIYEVMVWIDYRGRVVMV